MKKIFIVSGFSGSRKGTLVNKIMEKRSDIKVVKSYTTRPKRSEDDFYNFVSEAEFDELERNNLLLESNTYNGFRYGTLVTDVLKILQEESSVVLEIDFNGCKKVLESGLFKREMLATVFVVTDASNLYRRLLKRGTEDAQKIISRLSMAKEECTRKEGTLRYFYSSEIERDAQEELERLFNTQRFENSYIDIPNPFEVGDIVCLTTDNGHGVVVTSQEDWRQYKEIMKNAKYKNFGDASIIVDFLMDNGHISHAHVNPIFLEKYEPAEIDADKEVLYAASAVHKGDGLDWFTHCYDKYKKMCVRKASTLS